MRNLSTRNNGRLIERNAAWIPSLVGSLLYFILKKHVVLSPGIHDLFSAWVNIGAIAVGFLLTANSILVGSGDRWIARRAKEAGVYKILTEYMLNATWWSLSAAILSAVGLLFDVRWNLGWYPYAISAWIFVATGSVISFLRVLWVFGQVLLGLAED